MNLRFNRICEILVFVLLLTSGHISAQKPQFKFKTFTQADGLVDHTIQVTLEDSYGFLWLGTQSGLQKYDGISFKTYEHIEGDTVGLSSSFITSLCEDSNGNIWIGGGQGLNVFERETEKFKYFDFGRQSVFKVAKPFIINIINDKLNPKCLWLSIIGTGLVKLNKDSRNFELIKIDKNIPLNAPGSVLQHPNRDEFLFLGADNLFLLNTQTTELTQLLELEQNTDPRNNLINDMVVDPGNKEILWLATGDFWGQGTLGGLIQYNIRTGTKKIFTQGLNPDNIISNNLMALCFYDKNKLCIGTRNQGLQLYDKLENKFYSYTKNDWDPESIGTDESVRNIIKDKSGSLWFGFWGNGVSMLSSATSKFRHYKKENNNTNSLSDNYINTFTEDEDGNIWIGTKKRGVNKFNPRTSSFTYYFKEFWMNRKNPVPVTYLFYDSRQNLWVGTHNDGLYRYNPLSKTKIHYTEGETNKNVSKKRVTTVSEIGDGKIYVTTYGGGLNIYDYGTDTFVHYLNNPDDSTSIPDNQLWLPFTDDGGKIYFSGNNTSTLFSFDPEKETFENLDYLPISTTTMPFRSSSGRIFLPAITKGLNEFIPGDKPDVLPVLAIEGNLIKNVETILEDSQGNLWLATSNGLFQYDLETKILRRYEPSDGLQSSTFNRLAAFKSSSGEMYFGGINGFNVFHPEDIKLSSFNPNIVFTDFKLFNESVEIGPDSPVKKSLSVSNEIKLNHDQNDFSIFFAALDFAQPNRIKYKYILENHNTDWVDAGNKNYASYTNMDPGDFTFKVLATNSDGVWVKEPVTLNITINPPWWRTTAAYLGYGLLFLLGVFGVDKIQRNRLIRKERTASAIKEAELRAQIAESENARKTRELDEARALQLSMLPKDLPQLPNLDIAVYMNTATEVGGDYYDFHVHPDGTLTVLVGDATGHGMQAGMMVSIMKSLFMSDRSNKDIKPFFQNSSEAIKDMQLGRLMMALACIQFKGNKIRVANAGMPSVLIYKENDKQVVEMAINNLPLGAIKTFDYEVKELEITQKDTILIMSDGFAELTNENRELYGYRRAKNYFEEIADKEPEEIVNLLRNEGLRWSNEADAEDDVTFVVIKLK